MPTAPQIIKNVSEEYIIIEDLPVIDRLNNLSFVRLAPGETLDLFTVCTDEDIAKSTHLKLLIQAGIFIVVTPFTIQDTQTTALNLSNLEDADIPEVVADGTVLIYSSAVQKWVAVEGLLGIQTVTTEAGELVLTINGEIIIF